MDKTLKLLQALMGAAGDILLSDAITWVQVEENAEKLLAEGHEEENDA